MELSGKYFFFTGKDALTISGNRCYDLDISWSNGNSDFRLKHRRINSNPIYILPQSHIASPLETNCRIIAGRATDTRHDGDRRLCEGSSLRPFMWTRSVKVGVAQYYFNLYIFNTKQGLRSILCKPYRNRIEYHKTKRACSHPTSV